MRATIYIEKDRPRINLSVVLLNVSKGYKGLQTYPVNQKTLMG